MYKLYCFYDREIQTFSVELLKRPLPVGSTFMVLSRKRVMQRKWSLRIAINRVTFHSSSRIKNRIYRTESRSNNPRVQTRNRVETRD